MAALPVGRLNDDILDLPRRIRWEQQRMVGAAEITAEQYPGALHRHGRAGRAENVPGTTELDRGCARQPGSLTERVRAQQAQGPLGVVAVEQGPGGPVTRKS